MIITLLEIFYLILTTLLIGYIFTGYIPHYRKIPKTEDNLIAKYNKPFLDWEEIKFTIMVASPGIILHELSHKITGLMFGLSATYQIFWEGMGLGLILKLFGSPFLLLAPGYVVLGGNASNLASVIVAFSGPFINLLLFSVSWHILKTRKNISEKSFLSLSLLKQINLTLFIFNMIPIPGFDGFHVFSGLYNMFVN